MAESAKRRRNPERSGQLTLFLRSIAKNCKTKKEWRKSSILFFNNTF